MDIIRVEFELKMIEIQELYSAQMERIEREFLEKMQSIDLQCKEGDGILDKKYIEQLRDIRETGAREIKQIRLDGADELKAIREDCARSMRCFREELLLGRYNHFVKEREDLMKSTLTCKQHVRMYW